MAKQIISDVENGYDLVSDKFSATRKHFWRGLEFIGDYVKDGDRVLDFGCGNGRLLELIGDKQPEYFGVDVSQKLIEVAKAKYVKPGVQFQKIAGLETLPFPDNYFNVVYAVAVFHHLPGREARTRAVQELQRVLKPGGALVATVWNLWQPKYVPLLINNWVRKIFRRSQLDWKDCFIAFRDNQRCQFDRFHHAFSLGELRRFFQAGGLRIGRSGKTEQGNLWVIAEKR